MALPPGEQRDRDKLAASFIHRTGLASPTIWTSCHLRRWSVCSIGIDACLKKHLGVNARLTATRHDLRDRCRQRFGSLHQRNEAARRRVSFQDDHASGPRPSHQRNLSAWPNRT